MKDPFPCRIFDRVRFTTVWDLSYSVEVPIFISPVRFRLVVEFYDHTEQSIQQWYPLYALERVVYMGHYLKRQNR